MLRKTTLLALTILFLFTLTTIVLAEENIPITEDSLKISDAIVNQINAEVTDTVIRIYNIPITFAFAAHDNIDDILSSDSVLGIIYAKCDANKQYAYFAENGDTLMSITAGNLNAQAMQMCITGEVTKNIASDIVVSHTYYLSGENDHMGSAVYYKTNKGDFVYYNHYAFGERLFPVHAFCEFQKDVLREMIANGDKDGAIDLGKVWDLSPYDFKSASFNLNAEIPGKTQNAVNKESGAYWQSLLPLGICAIAAAIIIPTIIYIRKKNRSHSSS